VIEALVASVAGVIAGFVVGYFAARWAEFRAGLPLQFDTPVACTITFIAILLNLAFSCLSARRAATIDPTAALQYE
jgi:ABC-type antimicrobial peptide transport system permease subunit